MTTAIVEQELSCNALAVTSYLSRKWINDLHPCGTSGPITYKRAAIMFSIKNILERLDQSLDLMENPKQAGKTTAIGTLF
jgi:hypothetical protein